MEADKQRQKDKKKNTSGQTEGVITNNLPNRCAHLLISACFLDTNITVLLEKQWSDSYSPTKTKRTSTLHLDAALQCWPLENY